MTGADLHTLTGAYAVHALPETEREAFQLHLAECEACAQEVSELEATAARLGTAVAVESSLEMKDRVLARIVHVRQAGPLVAADLTERRREGPRRTTPRLRRLPELAVAACLAVACVCAGLAVYWQQETERARRSFAAAEQRSQRVSALLAAPDAVTASGQIKGGGGGVVVVSPSRDEVAFLAGGLPDLPEDRTYQLWFDDGGTMRSAGSLPEGGGGESVLIAPKVGGASGVGLTIEPVGGSPQPTTQPLLLLGFPV